MDLIEFFDKVEAERDMRGVSVGDEDIVVNCNGTDILLPTNLVASLPWDILYSALHGNGDITVLRHMTRVVGYYSRVENWNKSKLGELKDRHNGDYTLDKCE